MLYDDILVYWNYVLTCGLLPVQLVPGTEVAVAPKRRKTVNSHGDSSTLASSNGERHISKALLRIQDPDRRLVHKSGYVKGVELGVVLTSVAMIHPETAKMFSLNSLQLVAVVPRLSPKESMKNSENDGLRTRSSSTPKESNNGISNDKKDNRETIVRLLISDSVAKGHVMVAQSLRLYLRARLHSCA